MPQIVLYQFSATPGVDSLSPFCTKVHRSLGFKGLSYTPQDVAPQNVKKINPDTQKMPVLEYDGQKIPDSSKIIEFLENKHPTPALFPADPMQRARAVLLEDWADESLYFFGVYSRWLVDQNFARLYEAALKPALPAPLRLFVPGIIRKGVRKSLEGQGIGRLSEDEVNERLGKHLEMLVSLLGDGPFFVGEAVSVADVALFGPLQAFRSDLNPNLRSMVDAHPALLQWMKRVDRASASEHTAEVQ